MSSAPIYLERDGDIGFITLNQPARRNAMSQAMWSAMPGLISEAAAQPEVKTIIIHGGMAGAFSAGADISEFEEIYSTPETAAASGEAIKQALLAIERCPKPVIAAIDGACVGGGVSIATACDFRVAGRRSKFAVTPAKLGLVYAADDTRRLVELVGAARTKEILMTGRLVLAEEAAGLGLVSHLCEAGEALETARSLAASIGGVSQWSVRAVKRMVDGVAAGWDSDSEEARALFLEGFANEDFQEGYRAFLEKRPPDFTFR
jgi:enoyl-CoA hydratase/carnithine racemase